MIATLNSVNKNYWLDAVAVPALRDISVDIRANCFTVICGPSGSGKTTLLNLIGTIDRPDSGLVKVAGLDVNAVDDDELSDFRARHVGFVFQNFNLLPVLSAYENIEYPLRMTRVPPTQRKAKVKELLNAVGLADKGHHLPGQLSGGQRQRVAIARALAPGPNLILADEPTANLDSHTGDAIIALMRQVQRDYSVSFVFSSHDQKVIAEANDIVMIQDGQITSVERRKQSPSETI